MNAVDASAYLRLDPDAHRDPRPLFDALLAEGGIHRDLSTGFYLIADPRTVRAILGDPEIFSSADAFSPALTEATRALVGHLTEEQRKYYVSPVESIMTSDGALHQRLRKAVTPFFTKAAVERRRKTLQKKAAVILAALPRECDWVQDFCVPYTVRIIADIIGVPETELDTITRWDALLGALATGAELPSDALGTYLDFTKEFTGYFLEQAGRLANRPDDSLLSHLVQQGDMLTDHERIQFLLILFPAGSASTVILLTHIAVRLAQNPELIDQLRCQPDTVASFVEGCVVERTPSANIFRTTTREVTLLNRVVPAGSHLLLVLGAANKAIHGQAGHLSFGYGVHRCLGASLARAEGCAAVEEITHHFRRISLARPLETLPVRPHLLIPTHPHLPVQLDRAG
ncbi:cytochrome P450 [Nocardia thraciensis]